LDGADEIGDYGTAERGTNLKGDTDLLEQLNIATHEISLYLDYVDLFSDQILLLLQKEEISP